MSVNLLSQRGAFSLLDIYPTVQCTVYMTQNLGAVLPRRKHDGEVVVALLQNRRLVVAGKLGDAADQQRYRLALLPGYDEMDYCNWLLRLEPPINSRHKF